MIFSYLIQIYGVWRLILCGRIDKKQTGEDKVRKVEELLKEG